MQARGEPERSEGLCKISLTLGDVLPAVIVHTDDPRLRALEAYIISQRDGTALAYGKH